MAIIERKSKHYGLLRVKEIRNRIKTLQKGIREAEHSFIEDAYKEEIDKLKKELKNYNASMLRR